jgi:hypothetical protein
MPTEAEITVLLARTGLPLTPQQIAEITRVYPGLEAMQRSIRTPVPGPAAEPSNTFSTEPGR